MKEMKVKNQLSVKHLTMLGAGIVMGVVCNQANAFSTIYPSNPYTPTVYQGGKVVPAQITPQMQETILKAIYAHNAQVANGLVGNNPANVLPPVQFVEPQPTKIPQQLQNVPQRLNVPPSTNPVVYGAYPHPSQTPVPLQAQFNGNGTPQPINNWGTGVGQGLPEYYMPVPNPNPSANYNNSVLNLPKVERPFVASKNTKSNFTSKLGKPDIEHDAGIEFGIVRAWQKGDDLIIETVKDTIPYNLISHKKEIAKDSHLHYFSIARNIQGNKSFHLHLKNKQEQYITVNYER